jgi:hypothetical protein
LLSGLLNLFFFVSTAKADPEPWGPVKRDQDPSLLLAPPRNFHKNFRKCDEMAEKRDELATEPFFGWKKRGEDSGCLVPFGLPPSGACGTTVPVKLALRRVFVYSAWMKSKKLPEEHGRKGGRARTAAKSLAARQNILLRWHRPGRDGVIPPAALIDGAWYVGEGRSASVAYWDHTRKTFHTLSANSWFDPATYPEITKRTVRIKQERHVAAGGTFAPRQILSAAAS